MCDGCLRENRFLEKRESPQYNFMQIKVYRIHKPLVFKCKYPRIEFAICQKMTCPQVVL